MDLVPATGPRSSLPGGVFCVGRRPPSGRGHRINKDRGARNLRCVRDFLLSLAPGVRGEGRDGNQEKPCEVGGAVDALGAGAKRLAG